MKQYVLFYKYNDDKRWQDYDTLTEAHEAADHLAKNGWDVGMYTKCGQFILEQNVKYVPATKS